MRPRSTGRRPAHRALAIGIGVAAATVLAVGVATGDSVRAAPAPVMAGEGLPRPLPFRQVQAGEVVFEADPLDPTRGIFHVTTSEPMICAIVWGATEDLGRFNNSMAMDGTGIVDHDVYLPDIEPGRTYYYVIAGVTADGTQYRSDLDTFVIPEPATTATAPTAAPAPDWGPDLAADATVTDVSSEYSSQFAAANAIDGDLSTEWSSAGDGDDGWITIDLGRAAPIAGVEFVTRSMADGTAITTTFTVSVDGGEALGPFPAASPSRDGVVPIDATGRVLRFDVDASTGGNVGAAEIRVFAAAG